MAFFSTPTASLVPSSYMPSSSAISTSPGPTNDIRYYKPRDVLPLLGEQAQALGTEGTELTSQGQAALQPVLAHIVKLMSGDPQAISEAILPETQGVLAQYDTARRTAAEMMPRGGGQASAITAGRFEEAGQLANLRATARRSAVSDLAELGLKETAIGGQLSQAGLQGLYGLVSGSLQYEQMHPSFWKQIGSTVGSLAAMYAAPDLMPEQMTSWLSKLFGRHPVKGAVEQVAARASAPA